MLCVSCIQRAISTTIRSPFKVRRHLMIHKGLPCTHLNLNQREAQIQFQIHTGLTVARSISSYGGVPLNEAWKSVLARGVYSVRAVNIFWNSVENGQSTLWLALILWYEQNVQEIKEKCSSKERNTSEHRHRGIPFQMNTFCWTHKQSSFLMHLPRRWISPYFFRCCC